MTNPIPQRISLTFFRRSAVTAAPPQVCLAARLIRELRTGHARRDCRNFNATSPPGGCAANPALSRHGRDATHLDGCHDDVGASDLSPDRDTRGGTAPDRSLLSPDGRQRRRVVELRISMEFSRGVTASRLQPSSRREEMVMKTRRPRTSSSTTAGPRVRRRAITGTCSRAAARCIGSIRTPGAPWRNGAPISPGQERLNAMTRMRACAMRMDGRLLALAAALLLAAVVLPGLSLAATQNVTWINVTNAAANGNTLTKTGGCAGCQDAGASSQQQIA